MPINVRFFVLIDVQVSAVCPYKDAHKHMQAAAARIAKRKRAKYSTVNIRELRLYHSRPITDINLPVRPYFAFSMR